MARGRVLGAYLGKFRGLFKEFGRKTGGRAPPANTPPPSGSAPENLPPHELRNGKNDTLI